MRSILLYHLFYRWRNADPETMCLRSQSSINTACHLQLRPTFPYGWKPVFGNRVKNTIPFNLYNQRNLVICHPYVLRAGEGGSVALLSVKSDWKNKPFWGLKTEWNTRDWLCSNSSEPSGDGEGAWWLATEGRRKCSYGSLGAGGRGCPPQTYRSMEDLPEPPVRLLSAALHPPTGWTLPESHGKRHPPGISPPMLWGSLPMIQG